MVGWCQRVSKSMKCLKDALNHYVTVFYVLCITFNAYYALCIEDTMLFFVHYPYMILRILLINNVKWNKMNSMSIANKKLFNGMQWFNAENKDALQGQRVEPFCLLYWLSLCVAVHIECVLTCPFLNLAHPFQIPNILLSSSLHVQI